MKFIFIGEEDKCVGFGLEFIKGEEVDVTDDHAIKKLSGNGQFKRVEYGNETEVHAPPPREDLTGFLKRGPGRPRVK